MKIPNKTRFLILTILIFLGVSVFNRSGNAQELSLDQYRAQAKAEEYKYSREYLDTRQMCAPVNGLEGAFANAKLALGRQWNAGFQIIRLGLFDYKQAQLLFNDRGLSPKTAALLRSPGYWHALQECFPGKSYFARSTRASVTLSIIIDDMEGKTAGGAVAAAILLSPYKFFVYLRAVAPVAANALVIGGVELSFLKLYVQNEYYQKLKREDEREAAKKSEPDPLPVQTPIGSQFLKDKAERTRELDGAITFDLLQMQNPQISESDKETFQRKIARLQAAKKDLELAFSGSRLN